MARDTRQAGGGTTAQADAAAAEKKQNERRARTCLIVSGGLMECAGHIRRIRWALGSDLSEGMMAWLAESEVRLLQQAMVAEGEAAARKANPSAFPIVSVSATSQTNTVTSGSAYAPAAGPTPPSKKGHRRKP